MRLIISLRTSSASEALHEDESEQIPGKRRRRGGAGEAREIWDPTNQVEGVGDANAAKDPGPAGDQKILETASRINLLQPADGERKSPGHILEELR